MAKGAESPLAGVTFFLDENFGGKVIAGGLRAVGAHVEVHRDHFESGTADSDWLPKVGARGWVLLTKDRRIKTRPLEIAALRQAGVAAFVLVAPDMKGDEIASLLGRLAIKMARYATTNSRPFFISFGRTGKFKVVKTAKKARRKLKTTKQE